jgi:pimeloyl-ACP methyl ester carboxylesterase
MLWLDAVLDRLGIETTDVCGHSYGGWIGLGYALHAPARVNRLVLLDPTQCFAGFRPPISFMPCHYSPGPARNGNAAS